jgi:hypothetical protein
MAMLDVGIKVKPGSGVGAAIDYYRKNAPFDQKRLQPERPTTDSKSEINKPAAAKRSEVA